MVNYSRRELVLFNIFSGISIVCFLAFLVEDFLDDLGLLGLKFNSLFYQETNFDTYACIILGITLLVLLYYSLKGAYQSNAKSDKFIFILASVIILAFGIFFNANINVHKIWWYVLDTLGLILTIIFLSFVHDKTKRRN